MICCRLWKGKNKTGVVLDSSRLRGSLAKVFVETLSFIERNTKTGWRKTENGGREEVRSYPKEAIREALVNAIAHRDYSISGTQIDVDIYSDRIEIVSPGSWLLPKDYNEYPSGSIPSIRRNSIIAACLDVANLMERGGTGFQTMIESYKESPDDIQPVVSIYPGFLNLRLFDRLYRDETVEVDLEGLTDAEKVIAILRMEGPKPVKELQEALAYRSRSQFLKDVLNPMMESEIIYRDGKPKSPTALIKIKKI
jgi:predicted HTH transcriptional regulator